LHSLFARTRKRSDHEHRLSILHDKVHRLGHNSCIGEVNVISDIAELMPIRHFESICRNMQEPYKSPVRNQWRWRWHCSPREASPPPGSLSPAQHTSAPTSP
jgi:hypothetical protein